VLNLLRNKSWQLPIVLGTALIIVYLVAVPVLVLLYGSVSTARPGQVGTVTFYTYAEVLSSPRFYRILGLSLVYSVASALVTFVVGATMAWIVQRTNVRGKRLLTAIILFPLFMPSVLAAVSWELLLDKNVGFYNSILQGVLGISSGPFDVNTLVGMIWIRGIVEVPIVFLWMWPAFAAMDPSLEEAAVMSGSSSFKVLRTVTLPVVRPALLAAFLISVVLALEDVTVPILIGLPGGVSVFASEIFLATTRAPSDIHAASVYSVLLMVITVGLALWYRRQVSKGERFAVVRGRGYRPAVKELGRARWPVTLILHLFLLLTVTVPVLVVVWTSLANFLQVPSIEGIADLSFKWYQELWGDARALRGFLNSTLLGLVVAAIVMVLALVVAWATTRLRFRGRAALDFITFLPIAVPGLVVGLSLMWLYLAIPLPIYGTIVILGIAYVTRFVPYGLRQASSGLAQLHPELEEAAAISGSGWGRTARTILVPLLTPSVVAGFVYVFVRGFMELSASVLLYSYGNETYSVVAYSLWAGGEVSKTAAYGVAGMVIMTAVVLITQRLTGRSAFTNH
jgi:iron(III) transport system permease protein